MAGGKPWLHTVDGAMWQGGEPGMLNVKQGGKRGL